jgi:hypothetical protein
MGDAQERIQWKMYQSFGPGLLAGQSHACALAPKVHSWSAAKYAFELRRTVLSNLSGQARSPAQTVSAWMGLDVISVVYLDSIYPPVYFHFALRGGWLRLFLNFGVRDSFLGECVNSEESKKLYASHL